jgi:hypothetical protein
MPDHDAALVFAQNDDFTAAPANAYVAFAQLLSSGDGVPVRQIRATRWTIGLLHGDLPPREPALERPEPKVFSNSRGRLSTAAALKVPQCRVSCKGLPATKASLLERESTMVVLWDDEG